MRERSLQPPLGVGVGLERQHVGERLGRAFQIVPRGENLADLLDDFASVGSSPRPYESRRARPRRSRRARWRRPRDEGRSGELPMAAA
jgi:hypothetical protein